MSDERVIQRHHVTFTGHGERTLILSHGYGCDQAMWSDMVPLLSHRYRLVLYDHAGSGRCDPSVYDARRHANLDGYADDLLALCEGLDLRGAVFVGHSVSAMIGALAALKQPDRFSHLVMVAPSPCFIDDLPEYHGGFARADVLAMLDQLAMGHAAWSHAMAPVIMKNGDRPELGERLEQSFCAMDPTIALRWARATFLCDLRAEMPQVKTPSLLVQCSDDAIAPIDVGEWMQAHMPRSTLRVLQASGHCPHMSHPDDTARVVIDYLDGERRH